ncbi:MAG: hypothetical protein NTW21_42445 [Verrucomicrobia bacterium]|nr:hypothetical protein [Verrucomicrobiota bacterium]
MKLTIRTGLGAGVFTLVAACGLTAFAARAADVVVDDFKAPALAAKWKLANLFSADGGKVEYDYATGDGKLTIKVKEFKPKASQDALLCSGVTLEPGRMFIVEMLDFKTAGAFNTVGPVVTTGTGVSNRNNLVCLTANSGMEGLTGNYNDNQGQSIGAAAANLPGKLSQLFIARPLPNLYQIGYQVAGGKSAVVSSYLLPEGAPQPATPGLWMDLRGVGGSVTWQNARITEATGGAVVLPGMFSDHMVLQREKPVPVWGWAKAGAQITVGFAGQSKTAAAGTDGKWLVTLDPLTVSDQPQDMKIAADGNGALTLTDVLVGDVWLCSGQSNMEWPLNNVKFKSRLTDADFPNTIRWLSMPNQALKSPNLLYSGMGWLPVADKKNSQSAVGYYFARKIHQVAGVPVGMLQADWGGTRIETWTAPCGYELTPELTDEIKKQAATVAAEPTINFFHGVSVNYNGMIRPLAPYQIKGAIWYQGESNADMGDAENNYLDKTRALIGGWRKIWGAGDFPFYFVQLANLGKPNEDPAGGDLKWPLIREAQRRSLAIPNTGMAVVIDVGSEGTIHPANKMDVGERLALWALARDYGKSDLIHSGPLYKSHHIDAGKIRITFDHTGGTLVIGSKAGDYAEAPMAEIKDGKLAQFAIAGADKKWFWADAVIDGESVVVSCKDVPKPAAVRYAFSQNPKGCNLYNKVGLPASPFRTDDWVP